MLPLPRQCGKLLRQQEVDLHKCTYSKVLKPQEYSLIHHLLPIPLHYCFLLYTSIGHDDPCYYGDVCNQHWDVCFKYTNHLRNFSLNVSSCVVLCLLPYGEAVGQPGQVRRRKSEGKSHLHYEFLRLAGNMCAQLGCTVT